MLCRLIQKFIEAVVIYYNTGINRLGRRDGQAYRFQGRGQLNPQQDNPAQRRRMIEIIGEEWALLMSLVSSARLLPDDDPTINKLTREVITTAVQDIHLADVAKENIAVLPHFGRHFELVKFTYAQDIVVLGVPVGSLYCPWDWTFVWHEVAGIYVEQDRRAPKGAITSLLGVLSEVVSDLVPLLPYPKLRFEQGVLRNWSEELIEDSVGVLCLGDSMVMVLKGILARNYPTVQPARDNGVAARLKAVLSRYSSAGGANRPGTAGTAGVAEVSAGIDRRHPPRGLRIVVTQALTNLMLNGGDQQNPQPLVESILQDGPQISRAGADRAAAAVQRLAQDIWDHHQMIIRTGPISPDAVAKVAEVARDIGKEELPEGFSLQDVPSRIFVAAAARAFYSGVAGDQIRKRVYDSDSSYWGSLVGKIKEIPEEEFESYRFSETDRGDAEPSAWDATDWWGRTYCSIYVSNVTCWNGHSGLSGSFTLYH